MMNNQAKRGFTLIELLVVVLIIGILASVALPQYQKAVRRSRLSEVSTTFNSISKGIDMWLLENDGYPASTVYFAGTNKNAELDIELSCASEDEYGCATNVGKFLPYCEGGVERVCKIAFNSSKLDSGNYHWEWERKEDDKIWALVLYGGLEKILPDLCRWWANFYGTDRILFSGNPTNACNAYL